MTPVTRTLKGVRIPKKGSVTRVTDVTEALFHKQISELRKARFWTFPVTVTSPGVPEAPNPARRLFFRETRKNTL